MADIKALAILCHLIKLLEDLPKPPDSIDDADAYTDKVEKVLQGGQTEMLAVKTYVDNINKKLKELTDAIQNVIKQNQDAIRRIFDSFKLTTYDGNLWSPEYHEKLLLARESSPEYRQLLLARKLQEVSKKLMNDRLNDLINETEEACAKAKDWIALTGADLDNLRGCLDSWQDAKVESFKEEERKRKEEQIGREEEERRRHEEEKWRKEEEEQKRREEEERRKKEEEERKKREEDERKQREEETIKREEEERKQREEEERLRREEEKRRKQEEREKKKREIEERKQRQEEERLRREEEKRRQQEESDRKKREEKRRKEEEARKRREEEERKKKEEEERKKREEEERKQREEEERLRREEEKRRKQEEREKKKREEEEKKKREQEEAERKAEEERKRKEEEERIRREEEFRRQQEEEERKKREEEERKRKEEEERRRKAEEETKRREEERQRLEAEKREKERLRREAEEKAWRQDPKNWSPVIFRREDGGEVDGKRAYHGGVSCILTSPPGGIVEDDLECFASDEVDSIIEILEEEEKCLSSIIDIKSKKNTLHSEVPSRIYMPHYPPLSQGEEIVVKVSVNGSDWVSSTSLPSTSNLSEQEKKVRMLAGVEVNDFTSLQLCVVCRPRCQTIPVDKKGISVYSTMDKKVKLFVPRETFQQKTELRLTVKPISDGYMSDIAKEIPNLGNILAVNTFATLYCPKIPEICIEMDLLKRSQSKGEPRRGMCYQVYACGDKSWKLADVEYKGQQDDLTVSLPIGRHKYTVVEVEVPASFPKENVPQLVEELYTCVNRTRARLIVRQKAKMPEKCVVRVVKEEQCRDALDFLNENGFIEGPDLSALFSIQEGQHVDIQCTGNIKGSEETSDLTFLSYRGGIRVDMTLKVKDQWKQKDLPTYVGNIRCIVLGGHGHVNHSVEVTVSIPKFQRERTVVAFAPLRFPYYLTSLASYVAHRICREYEDAWKTFLQTLLGEDVFHTKYRLAKRKLTDDSTEPICKAILLDWMKCQAAHEDKMLPVIKALDRNKLHRIADDCRHFANYHKEHMTDGTLTDLASRTKKDVDTLAKALKLEDNEVQKCIKEHSDDQEQQKLALLMAWRESDMVVKYGDTALEHLRNICI